MSTTHEPLLERQRNALRHASQLPQNDPLQILFVAIWMTSVHEVPCRLTLAALKKQFWRLYARRYRRPAFDADELQRRTWSGLTATQRRRYKLNRPIDKTPIKYLP